MKFFVFLAVFISSVYAINFDIYNSTISNGRTTMIEFVKDKDVQYDKIKMGKKTFNIYNHPTDLNKMYVLLPVSYYEKPKNKKVKIFYRQNNEKKSKLVFLHVEDGEYKKEKIEVQKSKVNPKFK